MLSILITDRMDHEEQTIRLFSRALLHSVEVLAHVKDPYLYRTLQDSIEQSIRVAVQSGGDSRELSDAILEIHRCLEEISSFQADAIRPLLLAERHVLLLLLHVRSRSDSAHRSVPVASKRSPSAQSPKSSKELGNGLVNGHLSSSARQVLRGVQETEPVRAKDIIEHCSPMSERTIRRSLKELVLLGLVSKDAREGAIRYRAVQKADA